MKCWEDWKGCETLHVTPFLSSHLWCRWDCVRRFCKDLNPSILKTLASIAQWIIVCVCVCARARAHTHTHTHTHTCSTLSGFSCVQLFAALWIAALQAPLSMGFFRQENWSGLPRPSPGDLPDPETAPASLKSPASAGRFFTASATWEV